MNITLRGVRGSIPATSPDTKEYGGNTSCIEVEEDGWLLLLDAGSGIQHVIHDNTLHHNRVDILLTHLHIDHIQGLGFFAPLFNPSAEIHIWGPSSNTATLRARLGRYFSPPLFPVYFRNLTCDLILHEIDDSFFTIGPFSIRSSYVIHPGPTIGFRIQDQHGVIAYIPDHEPALGRNGLPNDTKWLSGGDLASGADVLLHDAQYSAKEYADKKGWGHSSMQDALQFAALTRVKHLLFTHHDPLHSDTHLNELFARLKENSSCSFAFEMAVEGMKIKL